MLNLACRGVVGGLTRSGLLAKAAYAVTLPFRLLDRVVGSGWRRDFAIGAYFLGTHRGDDRVIDVDPVDVFTSTSEVRMRDRSVE